LSVCPKKFASDLCQQKDNCSANTCHSIYFTIEFSWAHLNAEHKVYIRTLGIKRDPPGFTSAHYTNMH
jgi:hypothetical protein